MTTEARNKPYYGWYITVALAITETISWGIIFYAVTVFIKPMEDEFGWTRAALTGGPSLGFLIAGMMGIPAGIWIDRFGARWLMTFGSIGASVLVLLWSLVQTETHYYLVWMGLGICMAAVLYEPAFAVIANWFVQRRGQALAVVTFAAGFASTIFIPLADTLFSAFGWRGSVAILAVFLAVTTIPLHILILRRRPEDLGLEMDGGMSSTRKPRPQRNIKAREALRETNFWFLTGAFFMAAVASAAIRFHFIPFLIDRGINSSVAAYASGSIGAMQVVGRVVFAPLESRLPARVMAMGVFAVLTLAMVWLMFVSAAWGVAVFVILFGTSVGAMTLARPVLIADLYGSAQYGRISSVMSFFITFAATGAPFVAGLLYDAAGNYDLTIVLMIGFALVSVGTMYFVHIPEAREMSTIGVAGD